MKHQKRSVPLFDKYSENLKYFIGVKINSNPADGYLCPLSMIIYLRQDLFRNVQDGLTVEHVPPRSVDGKAVCLINRKTNSITGHTIDKELLKSFKYRQFGKNKGFHSANVEFPMMSLGFFRSRMKIHEKSSDGKRRIEFKPGNKNYERLKKNLSQSDTLPEMRVNFKDSEVDHKKINSAYLKIAYLKAFSKLGYALIFNEDGSINETYEKIREQILNPDRKIVPKVPIYQTENKFEDGVYIISSPKRLRSIMVAFTLSRGEYSEYYSAMLPLPYDSNFETLHYQQFYIINPEPLPEIHFTKVPDLKLDQKKKEAYWMYIHLGLMNHKA